MGVNNNPVKSLARYHLKTKLLEKAEKLLWWEVKEINFPIQGTDNFNELRLKTVQDAEDSIDNRLNTIKREDSENTNERVGCIESQVYQLKRETLKKFQKLFEENKTLKDFKY